MDSNDLDPKDIVDLEDEADARGYFAVDEVDEEADDSTYRRPPSRSHQVKTIWRKLVSTRH